MDASNEISLVHDNDNPYLALRAAKIARNNAKLNELGLLKPSVKHKRAQIKDTTQSTGKTSWTTSRIDTHTHYPTTRMSTRQKEQPTTRRSLRIAQHHTSTIGPVRDRKRPKLSDPTIESATPKSQQQSQSQGEWNLHKSNARSSSSSKSQIPPALNSVKRIKLSVCDTVNQYLGRSMTNTGKACVIQTVLGRGGGAAAAGTDINASFNKYSGVQEWANDAIFLWVNVGKKDDTIINEFLDGGRRVTWYGGSRMHDETPVIQKLIRIGQSASSRSESAQKSPHHKINEPNNRHNSNSSTTTDDDPDDGIVLWCRHYNSHTKTYHPYTCLGRLSYESHVPHSHPLKFIWKLRDYERLVSQKKEQEDVHHQEWFQQIVHS